MSTTSPAPVAYPEEEWVRRIARVVGWQGRILVAPREALPESLRRERTIDWERENPPAELELDYESEDAVLEALACSR